MYIDPHVHFRDGRQAHKETIKHGLYVAEQAGYTAVMAMPNTDPLLTELNTVLDYLALAEQEESPVEFYVNMGLTSDAEQIARAVDAKRKNRRIAGFKMFAGESVGELATKRSEDQYGTYKRLAQLGYEGVVMVHCEEDSLMKKRWDESKKSLVQDWDPRNPATHAYSRPPEMETVGVRNQIQFARDAGFQGHLHVAHISVPEAVDYVNQAKQEGMRISCGVTPHHVLFDLHRMEQSDGLLYKMNPPLRPEGMNTTMLSYLMQGKISMVESDHAPHTLEEKLGSSHMSGIPVLHFSPKFFNMLERWGTDKQILDDVSFNNANRIFGLNLERRETCPILNLREEYPVDAFRDFW